MTKQIDGISRDGAALYILVVYQSCCKSVTLSEPKTCLKQFVPTSFLGSGINNGN